MARFATKDNLKTIVDALRGEMPDATSATPKVDGTASAGTSDDYARADHVHPTDTSRASTDVATTSTNGLMSSADKTKLNGIASGATANAAASATPKVDGTAAVGTSAKYAREDHVHPTDTTRAAASDLTSHTGNTTVHITAAERTAWNAKTSNTGTVTSVATGAGLTGGTITGSGTIKADLKSETKSTLEAASMGSTASRQYAVGLDKNGDLSVNVPWENTAQNQNAFSNVKVGSTTVAADTATDTLELVAGSNVTLTPDVTNDKVTIAAKDTTYSAMSQSELDTGTSTTARSITAKVLGDTFVRKTERGAASGVAELDENGLVVSSQLPSFVDDVLEYSDQSAFPATGESGKIYVDLTTNKTYRWSGSAYTEISPSLALGETSSTAYRGDRGKTAYDHAAAKGSAFSSGLYKITTNAQGHVTAATAVAKSDITALGIPAQDTTYIAASATPKVDGTAAVGTSAKYAREDHVHPTDTTRAATSDLTSHTDNTTVHITAAERTAWNAKTSNTGTVTSVATGAGLTGGTITGSGTIKADLKSETKSTLEAASMGSTASRQYAVGLDKNGDLSVNVPWENTKYTAASTAPKVDGTAAVGSSTKYAREDHVHPTDTTRMAASLKGAASGVAELDENGKVPSSQLPSYVDDVLEYSAQSAFPTTGESGKIYVDLATNKTYRWSGSTYTEISPSLALGETSSTAYRGDRGKTAYDHAAAKGSAFSSGLYKITTNAQGHVTAATAVAKSDITALGIPAQDTTYTAASATPKADGTAAVGTSAKYAREDHVHPTDTTRAAASDLTSHTGNTTVHVSATEKSLWNRRGVEYINGTQTAVTGSWTGVTEDASLSAGKMIAYRLPYNGSGSASLNLTLSDGSTTGEKAVFFGASRVTTQYPAGTIIFLAYNGTDWRTFDYNSDTYNRIRYDRNITAAEAITANRLICGTSSGYRDVAAGVSFSLSYPILCALTAIAKGATSGTLNNNFIMISNVNYSTTGTITSGGNNKVIYLKGTLSGNTFTVASSPFLTTVEPTSADGLAYIPLGIMMSATNGFYSHSRDVMSYVGGKFQKITSLVSDHIADTTSHITTAERTAWNAKAGTSTATTSANGLMSSTDKSKLDGIASGATANTAASTAPKVDGTAAVGTSAKYAREDHVHPTDTTRAAASDLTSHTGDTTSHITAAERTAWNAKTSNTGTVTSVATGAGLTGGTITGSGTIKADLKSETKSTLEAASMGSTASRQYAVGLDKNGDLSVNVPWENTAQNQNAFSNVKVGSTTIAADTTTDTIELVAGSNVTLTPDATNDKVTIAATNTTYSAMSQTELDTGTATTARSITAKVLSDTFVRNSEKGAASGVAELDENGLVVSSQLPSFVDDVLEYSAQSSFPTTGETGKIYVDLTTNKTYRWSGSAYTEISPSLALGETSATAYRGDRGKTAYDHAAAKGSAFSSGLYKITTNAQGHVTTATAVTKADITALGIPAQDTKYTAASATPKVDGTAAVGTSAKYAREDHVHPTDTSRAAASDLTSHTGNTTVHITAAEREQWNKRGIEYIVGTHGTTATNVWTGTTTDSALYTGKCIAFYMTSSGTSTAATLNLTLSGGGTTGAKPVRINNSNMTTHFPVNSVIFLTYDGTYWKTFDYNSDTMNRVKYDQIIAAAENITSSHLICGTESGYRNLAAGVSFDIAYPLLWAGSTIAKGATTGTRNNNYVSVNNVNYSTTGTITSGAANKMLYLKGKLSGNTFTVASTPFLTTVEPTSADGFVYIPLGVMVSATNGYFQQTRDVMEYVNGEFRKVSPTAQLGGVNIPSAVMIPNNAFKGNSAITTVDLSTCVAVGTSAFDGCSNLTSVSLPACTTVGDFAFKGCSTLEEVNLPACTMVGANAFQNCSLMEVDLPSCTTIEIYAFQGCSTLEKVYLPACTTVKTGTFYSCSALYDVYLPACTTVRGNVFNGCSDLYEVDLPACTTVGDFAFNGCPTIEEVNLPACTTVGDFAFNDCSALYEVDLPACTMVGSNAFRNCSTIASVSLPVCTSIGGNAFGSCYNLISLYLTSVSSVPTLGTNVFSSTPIGGYSASAGQYGSVYVPMSLVDAFKVASGWSSVEDRIVGVGVDDIDNSTIKRNSNGQLYVDIPSLMGVSY